ncbi:lycopene cyclase domain-containing protein [Sediminihabitans luteus]|uniref:Lycopene cyclase domain-containing protein n=1 Tax=Sediminihabitans luteus TaxID=1138585 RepID=A0A2M9D065_9CELL|nr:prenyltransferase [Sediminihabitans luteus]PJJ77594.1 lycopene cyclase domain-containing protein [Sediminihabitans luteus]GII98494.1 hypothetical protein Slu03_08720 [Sediminihabitans luteus]
MTNVVLNIVVVGVLALVCVPVILRRPRGTRLVPLLVAAGVMCALTLVFDTIMIDVGLYTFDPDKILGVWLWGAPLEDFFYPVAAVLMVPALWTWLERRGRRTAREERAAGRSQDDEPDGVGARDGYGALETVRAVLAASRPFSWVNTAYPFAAGYLVATGGRVDAALVVGTLYFLVPYNVLMYGINDVFDYESDLRNPRKGGIEGALVAPERARTLHRRILWATVVTNVPFLALLVAWGDLAANLVLAVVVFLVIAYSAPVLRFKERAFVDSFTSAMHFVGPLLYALVLVDAPLDARSTWPVLVAFVLWGAASQAFGAVQDVRADRAAGLGSVATVIGARATVLVAAGAYVVAALVLLVLGWPGALAAILPLPYAVNVLRFRRLTDDDAERANAGWRAFLWLNLVTGFCVTMLLIAANWP